MSIYFQLLDVYLSSQTSAQKFKHAFCHKAGFQPLCAQSRTLFEPMFDLRDRHRSRLIRNKNSHFQHGSADFSNQSRLKNQSCVWTRSGFQPLCAQSQTLFEPMFDLKDRHRSRLIRNKNSHFQHGSADFSNQSRLKNQSCVWTRSGFQPLCAQSQTLFEPMFDLRDRHRSRLIRNKNSHFQPGSVDFSNQSRLKNQSCVWTRSGFQPLCVQSRTLFEPIFDLKDRQEFRLTKHKNMIFQPGSVYL